MTQRVQFIRLHNGVWRVLDNADQHIGQVERVVINRQYMAHTPRWERVGEYYPTELHAAEALVARMGNDDE